MKRPTVEERAEELFADVGSQGTAALSVAHSLFRALIHKGILSAEEVAAVLEDAADAAPIPDGVRVSVKYAQFVRQHIQDFTEAIFRKGRPPN